MVDRSAPSQPFVYLDNGATTRTDPVVVEAMLPYFTERFGNPSSIHALGARSRRAVEEARAEVAAALGCDPDEVLFTSGGTEADNLAVRGAWNASRGSHVVMTNIEHPAVLSCAEWVRAHGGEVTLVDVEPNGIVDADHVLAAVREDTAVVAVMAANNEIGTVQPVDRIGAALRQKHPEVFFFVDAVQAFTKLALDVRAIRADAVAVSSHKIHGPKGVGALYLRRGRRIEPLQSGGSQERGVRPGTENVPGIVGFAKAVELATRDVEADRRRMAALRNRLLEAVETHLQPVSLNGDRHRRLCNNLNVNFHGARAEVLLHMLEAEGLYCSSGAACHSQKRGPSHVLRAIGLRRDEGSLRLTLSRHTTEADIERAIDILRRVVPRARAMAPAH